MDFMKLPEVQREGKVYNQLFVVVDRFSKYTYLIPQNVWYTAEQVANDFYRHIYINESLPSEILSDRDAKFTSNFWQETLHLMRIKPVMSTAFHPQTDGQTEQKNRETLNTMRSLLCDRGDKWIDIVAEAQAALNFRIDSTTQKSPFEICREYPPRIIPWPLPEAKVPAAADPLYHRQAYFGMVNECLTNARSKQAANTNKHRRTAPQYQVGDLVMLSSKNIKPDGDEGKLTPLWIGPYAVTNARHDTENYSLQLPPRLQKIHNNFHTSLLKPFIGNNNVLFPSRINTEPPPLNIQEIDIEDVYEVDHIRGRRFTKKNGAEYLIRWKGYSPADDSWEPEHNIPAQLTCAYNQRNPRTPAPQKKTTGRKRSSKPKRK